MTTKSIKNQNNLTFNLMKKSFLFTMVALVAFNLQLMAEPVSLEKAQDQAREFLQSI